MSPLLMALLGVLLLPLFIGSWRASLFGLCGQGLLLGWIAYRLHPNPAGLGGWLTLVDLTLVRGVLVPLAFYEVLARRAAASRNDVIPPNLLSWTVAFVFVLLAFSAAARLVPAGGTEQTVTAVAGAGLLLGFLVLATQSSPFSQMVGALRIENAIALVELGGHDHHVSLGIQLGLLGVFLATVALFRRYLGLTFAESLSPSLPPTAPEALVERGEGPVL